jgi:hypothetical protein
MSEKRISKGRFALLGRGLLLAAVGSLFVLTPSRAMAWPCDFLTGGGWIVHYGAHANFGVGGGCKFGLPDWGHLEYIDHGTGLNVHWTSITAYWEESTSTDPKTGQPIGARHICGAARTNLYGDVYFHLRAADNGEPGTNDQFDIRLRQCASPNGPCSPGYLYDTTTECYPHYLGSDAPCSPGNGGGGNIQLHKPNPSTTGSFGGSCTAELP